MRRTIISGGSGRFKKEDKGKFPAGELRELQRQLREVRERNFELTQLMAKRGLTEDRLAPGIMELASIGMQPEILSQRYFELFQYAPEAYLSTNAEGVILQANHAARHLLGSGNRSLVGVPLPSLVVEEERRQLLQRIAKIDDGDRINDLEICLKNESGEGIHVCMNVIGVRTGQKNDFTLQWLIRDVSERKYMEEQLRAFPSRLIAAQEEERKRIAGELHDSIGQTLVALKYWVETILVTGRNSPSEAVMARLEQFVPVLQRAIEETRSICAGLRPAMLEVVGIHGTLQGFCKEFRSVYPNMQVQLDADVPEDSIPESLKIAIFRITQEALNNIAKHSGATRAGISLILEEGMLHLSIEDNGTGFDINSRGAEIYRKGLGLTGMRERTELTGGTFRIESFPGKGTKVETLWPAKIPNHRDR